MEKEKKSKLINISLWALLGVMVLFVIISSSIIKFKQDHLNDLSDKNTQIEDKLKDEGSEILNL